jgi:hypothetical protein
MNNQKKKKNPRYSHHSSGQVIQQNALQRNTRKWFFSYVQRNVIASINHDPDSLVLGARHSRRFVADWSFLFSDLFALRQRHFLLLFLSLPSILLIKPVILLHIVTLDVDSPASLQLFLNEEEFSCLHISPIDPLWNTSQCSEDLGWEWVKTNSGGESH